MPSVCCSIPEALAAKRSSCSASTPTPILSAVFADRIGCRDRAVHERSEAADGRHARERAAERADAGAQQLGLAAEVFEPTGSFVARGLDAFQALLAALADRDQLGLGVAAALDRQADGVGVGSSGHGSAYVLRSGAGKRGRGERSRDQDASGVVLIANQ
jgi:hypothetical protein